MSTLILARHGQARAFTDDPDRLSPLGWRQARRLGRYWAASGTRFDLVCHGALRRQRETFEAVAGEFEQAGRPFPEARVLPGLDEYGTQDLMSAIAPRIARSDPEFEPLWRAWRSVRRPEDRNRRFQLMFEALVTRWVDGRIEEPGLEPWETFRKRAEKAIRVVMESAGRGVRVVAFTSGGPIGVAVQTCLRAPPMAALEVNWRVRNTSLTTFLFSGSRLSLDGFNELPHLAGEPDLASFR